MIGRVVGEAASRFGERTAYVAPADWTLSYRQLDQRSDEVAAGLARRGLGRGDVLALVLPTLPEHVIAYVAAAKLGAVTAGINARLAPPERAVLIEVAGPRLVLATADLAPARPTDGAELVEVVPAEREEDVLADLRVDDASPPAVDPDPHDPVAIVFTSGTTGTPKAAVFANRQLEAITAIDTGGRWGGGGAGYAATSLAHLGPTTKLPGNLHRGGTTHLVERWRAADALAMIERHRMSSIGGIPTQVALMLQQPDFDSYDLSSLRAIVLGGGPSTPALVRTARQRFGAAVAVRYSCTEAGIGVGTAFDDPDEDAEVSVGRPLAGVELAVLDDDDCPVAPGEVGQVTLRSAAVMDGYHRDPDATAAVFTADRAVRTGDLGWVDDHGRLRLVGRSKEMYVRGGYNVYPAEVEAVLAAHPAVADVAVSSRTDPVMGEVGVAVVVARPDQPPPTLEDLRAHAGPHLARHKLPEDLLAVDALPLTAMEKLDRAALHQLVLGRSGPA